MHMHYYAARPHQPGRTRDGHSSGTWQPRVDIREDAGHYVILADVPGVDPRTIAVEMDGNILSISGERAAAAEGRYSRAERRRGAFRRGFVLPENADVAAIVATGEHGVLELRIPKKPELAPRRIQVGVRTLDDGVTDSGAASSDEGAAAGASVQ